MACLLALLGLCASAPLARAQEFAGSTPSGESRGLGAMLEHGLVGPTTFGVETGVTRWFALPDLQTRTAALGLSARSLHVTAGVAATGEREWGWNTAAMAVGVAQPTFAVAMRAAFRRDRDWWGAPPGVLGRATGAEAGAGAWLQAAAMVRVWVSAPQIWTRGTAPPLARALESGVRVGDDGLTGWLALRAPTATDDGARVAGASLARGGLACWAEVTDGPLRASVGVRAELVGLACGVRLDAHPVLGETTRLTLAWAPRAREHT